MASRVDLNGIKESIQNLLIAANTTTASPIDLSSGLANSRRVQQVLKIHPEKIPLQASFFPAVTCYVTDKSIKSMDIASSQESAKRRATIQVEVVGAVWNNNLSTVDEDPADEDINYLMENIELIFRSNYNLSGKVTWQQARACRFYTSVLDEQTHLRAGILSLECEVYY